MGLKRKKVHPKKAAAKMKNPSLLLNPLQSLLSRRKRRVHLMIAAVKKRRKQSLFQKQQKSPAKAAAAKKDESSSDDSSSEDEAEKKPAAATKTPTAAAGAPKRKAESSSDDSSDSEAAAPAAKKGKFVTSTPAPPKAKPTPSPEESEARDSGIEDDKSKFAQGKKTANAPYRRIQNYGEIEVKQKLNDNSFESKAGFDTWGAKASQDLIVTRGKSFRHEKTKKKRGSYKGGSINMGVASIKFDSD